MRVDRMEAVLKAAGENVEMFDDRTIQFCEDMLDRVDKWAGDVWVSEKQLNWLKSIESELERNGVDIEEAA